MSSLGKKNKRGNLMELKGVYTALVTPFKTNGDIDFKKIQELVQLQIQAGVSGIVPVGTTGESPTLTQKERNKTIETVVGCANHKCQIIAGTGANSTHEAVLQTKDAKKIGADFCLQVTPYYNKPSQDGLYKHFSEVANVGLPVVLYNVPGRTGVQIAVDTIKKLSLDSNIVGIKEAGGCVDRVSEILSACDITILSGDDPLTLPMLSVGAKGVISVAANLYPKPLVQMVNSFFSGNLHKAKELHFKYYNFMKAIFVETNPIPIKAAMAKSGLINEIYRLPLCPISDANRIILYETINNI